MVRVWRKAMSTTGYAYALMQSLIQATLLISSISLLRVEAETRRQASPLSNPK